MGTAVTLQVAHKTRSKVVFDYNMANNSMHVIDGYEKQIPESWYKGDNPVSYGKYLLF